MFKQISMGLLKLNSNYTVQATPTNQLSDAKYAWIFPYSYIKFGYTLF